MPINQTRSRLEVYAVARHLLTREAYTQYELAIRPYLYLNQEPPPGMYSVDMYDDLLANFDSLAAMMLVRFLSKDENVRAAPLLSREARMREQRDEMRRKRDQAEAKKGKVKP